MARRGERRSAASFALPYGYLTPKESLPNEASPTNADINMAVQLVMCSRQKLVRPARYAVKRSCLGQPPTARPLSQRPEQAPVGQEEER